MTPFTEEYWIPTQSPTLTSVSRYMYGAGTEYGPPRPGYSGPHFSDRRVSYTRRSRRWSDGEASASHGGVQGPGRPGGDQGGQDGQRGGRPVRRPPDPDPRLEEEAPGRGGGRVRGVGQGGPGGRRPA